MIPIPGASAVLRALSAAGTPSDAFRFGFLPPKSSQRRRALEERKADDATLIFYETPHRILDALDRYRGGDGRAFGSGGARADEIARGIFARHCGGDPRSAPRRGRR